MVDLADQALRRSPAQVKEMSKAELLEAIWTLESAYKPDGCDHSHDHRRYLDRAQLETVYFLAQRRAQLSQKS